MSDFQTKKFGSGSRDVPTAKASRWYNDEPQAKKVSGSATTTMQDGGAHGE